MAKEEYDLDFVGPVDDADEKYVGGWCAWTELPSPREEGNG